MVSIDRSGGLSVSEFSIRSLANHPDLVVTIGDLRWKEWGHPPEPTDRLWWIEVTRRESGAEGLPVTFVAVDAHGSGIGAVGLDEFDIDERRDRSPWLQGMIVRPDRRGEGVGRGLLEHLEVWASKHGFTQLWAANEGPAVDFYRRCGWVVVEIVPRLHLPAATVLTRHLGS
jgi:GNAT superfamily N-acetyltransferase